MFGSLVEADKQFISRSNPKRNITMTTVSTAAADTAAVSLAALATSLAGVPATFTPNDTLAALEAMEVAAEGMGKAIGVAEAACADSAKAWGCQFLNLNKLHGIDGDSLAERTRTRLGWADLRGEAGSKVKTRFNTWRSNIGKVSGKWDLLEQTVKDELLAGKRSFITVYKDLDKAEKDAKRAKDAEAAAAAKALELAAAAAANDAGKGEAKPDVQPEAPVSVADMLLAVADRIGDMSLEDFTAASDAFALFMEVYDAKVNAAADAGLIDVQPIAAAA